MSTAIPSPPAVTADIVYKIAGTRAERLAAFRLVYQAYLQVGLEKPNRFAMRVTPYHLLPTTDVFIAVCGGEVISTLSLVADGELGLPMESMYRQEVARRRGGGHHVAEVSCLAHRCCDAQRFLPIVVGLGRLMAQFARKQGVDQLLAAVHPKHARFYARYMSFEPIGNLTSCPHVCNRPAVALCLDFHRVDKARPRCYEAFFGEPIPDEELQPQRMAPAQREYFRQAVDPSFHWTPLVFGDFQAEPTHAVVL